MKGEKGEKEPKRGEAGWEEVFFLGKKTPKKWSQKKRKEEMDRETC